jgi:CDP-diacylglycerol--serine O-phosphatidyltransferase
MKRPKIGGAVYILPNALTTGNLFWGFFSIIKSLQGDWWLAGMAILLAAVFDILDGRVARLTKGTSEFGVQYDSLCDLVSFGCAPAFLMYQFALMNYGRIGWILCFLFLACGALRLARFNVQSSIGKASGDFTGLPIPMAAAVIATFVPFVVSVSGANDGFMAEYIKPIVTNQKLQHNFLLAAAPLLALAMVSNVVYRSHKVLKVRSIKPFKILAIMVFGIALVATEPEAIGFLFCFLYAISGLFEWIVGWKKATEDDDIFSIDAGEDQSIEDHEHEGDLKDANLSHLNPQGKK